MPPRRSEKHRSCSDHCRESSEGFRVHHYSDRFPIENQKMKSKFQGGLNFIGVPNKRDLVVDLFFSLCLAMEAIELKSMENDRSQRTCNDVNVSFARKICKLKL